MENTDDRLLAALIKEGNESAFATIYDRYHRQLYGLAFRYLKGTELAEDAVQHIFVNFWLNRERINEHSNIKSLLFTSLKNHVLNTLRNNQRAIEKNYEILMNALYDAVDEEESADSIKMQLIQMANQSLSPQRQEIFHLKIVDGLSNQEIADKLNISVNTVKVQYYHTLKAIKAFVVKKSTLIFVPISYIIIRYFL